MPNPTFRPREPTRRPCLQSYLIRPACGNMRGFTRASSPGVPRRSTREAGPERDPGTLCRGRSPAASFPRRPRDTRAHRPFGRMPIRLAAFEGPAISPAPRLTSRARWDRIRPGRARRGARATLYPKRSACGAVSPPEVWQSPISIGSKVMRTRSPRGRCLRTPSGPEGSSGKWAALGAAGSPGLSWRVVRDGLARIDGGCTTTFLPLFFPILRSRRRLPRLNTGRSGVSQRPHLLPGEA
jgi:hypothetical protein